MISLYKDKYSAEKEFLKNYFSLFLVDSKALDKNIWLLTKRSEGGFDFSNCEDLPFWRYEQLVSIANELNEEEKNQREQQEKQQKQSSGGDPSSYLNKISGMADKFKN